MPHPACLAAFWLACAPPAYLLIRWAVCRWIKQGRGWTVGDRGVMLLLAAFWPVAVPGVIVLVMALAIDMEMDHDEPASW